MGTPPQSPSSDSPLGLWPVIVLSAAQTFDQRDEGTRVACSSCRHAEKRLLPNSSYILEFRVRRAKITPNLEAPRHWKPSEEIDATHSQKTMAGRGGGRHTIVLLQQTGTFEHGHTISIMCMACVA